MAGRLVNSWTPGTTYPPNSVVRPTSTTGQSSNPPTNAGFETGDLTGWTASAGFSVVTTSPYTGTYCAKLAAGAGANKTLVNTNQAVATFGQIIRAQCYVNMGTNTSAAQASCTLTFYDSGHVLIGTYEGTAVFAISGVSGWQKVTVEAPTLIGSAFVAIGGKGTNNAAGDIFFDAFSWDYLVNPYDAPLLFYAVQTGTGKSGQVEPAWATTPPNINDGTVIWSSHVPTSILWLNQPLMKSGSVEPTWPTVPGQYVKEDLGNNMAWIAVTPQVTDANCPQSKYVMIASSKVFAADNDIVRFSATANPTDWTTPADAGFLPTGLQSYGKNPFKAVGLYRSNGVFFNADGMQMWQLDEDPANMALLDAIPIGSTQNRALASVSNDLFFLANQGVRTMGISAGSGNLQAGDVGMPIDPLVQAAVTWATANSVTPIATYFPSAGQYWLAIPQWPATGLFVDAGGTGTTTVFVYTMSRIGEVGAWSRYLFPVVIEDFTQFGDSLYVRAKQPADNHYVTMAVVPDLTGDTTSAGTAVFTGIVQWPWLDDGTPGQLKQLLGFDAAVTQTGTYGVQIGYDQSSLTTFTTSVTLTGDTVPGQVIPMALMAPSFSLRMTLTSDTGWQINAVNFYLQDDRPTS